MERAAVSDTLRRILDTAMTADPRQTPTERDEKTSAIARELGLTLQAERLLKTSAGIKVAFGDQLLEGEELAVWAAYCPTRYVEGSPGFANYGFDNVPAAVLIYWKDLKTNFAFDSFEIWTTEKTRNSDPLLIGIYQGARYLLARWGAEAEDLLQYREVRERVKAALRRGFTLEELPGQVAKTIRSLQEKNPVASVTRREDWNTGRFIYKKCCDGQRLLAFNVATLPGVTGVCPGCGGTKHLGYDDSGF